ncbi:MAG TPA: undecaprenyl-diphosphate phosphatase, partial [Tissierellaceae bacterium]|nr:undecaprenyl-diphosphate phosphatase [Tissierellaceae bacterium]
MEIIEIIKAIILGIVEGITEWLPISSTGHMILVDEFMQLSISAEFKEMFFVVIQLGAIMAVVLLYFNKLNPFSPRKTAREKRDTWVLWFKVVVAVIPAGVIGVLYDDIINDMFYNYVTVAITLIIYGVLFILVENRNKGKRPKINDLSELTYKTAFLIGVFQVLSLIPGTSRSGATIVGAMLVGTSRFVATEFTFFLAIPVMFGASLLKLLKFGLVFTSSELVILSV